MPSIRLKFPKAWYERIQAAADRSNQTTEEFIRSLVALTVPSPPKISRGHSVRLPSQEALVQQATQLCRALDATRGQLVAALDNIARKPRRRSRVAEERQFYGPRLRAALRRKGLTHAQAAAHIGVTRVSVTKVVSGSASLPPAWLEALDTLLGRDWLDERVDD